MKLTFIAKDSGSNDGGCPASYLVDEAPAEYKGPDIDGVVIQGIKLDRSAMNQLHELGDHETAVFVPANVIATANAALEGRAQ